jgi:hypothetical protein
MNDMLQTIGISIAATVIVVPLAVLSLAWTVSFGLSRWGVSRRELRHAIDGVLANPQACAHLLAGVVIGLCIMLGQVYS